MENGAIVNTKDNNGEEPFHAVLNRGNETKFSLKSKKKLFALNFQRKLYCLFDEIRL